MAKIEKRREGQKDTQSNPNPQQAEVLCQILAGILQRVVVMNEKTAEGTAQ